MLLSELDIIHVSCYCKSESTPFELNAVFTCMIVALSNSIGNVILDVVMFNVD